MTDRLELRGLRMVAICGALPEERDRPQPLEVDLDIETAMDVAGQTDDLADTVDYGAVCDAVAATTGSNRPQLLEHLAEQVVVAVLAVDDRIDAVTVAVRKLRPPVPHELASSGVRITRRR